MIDSRRILATEIGRGKDPFEAHYAEKDGKIHVFISRIHEVGSFISHLQTKETERELEGQLFNCRLIGVGDEYDEYLAREAFIGADKAIFKANQYKKAIFTLSNDLLPFFNAVWNIGNFMSATNSQQINFTPEQNRQETIEIQPGVSLVIKTGYRQNYSKIRYEAHSSVAFYLFFKKPTTKENLFYTVKAITEYYSLFCLQYITIKAITLFPSDEKQVLYFGEFRESINKDFFSNILLEQDEMDAYSTETLKEWMKEYEKCKVVNNLIKDAQNVTDPQLKFICLSRALEVLHKEFFVSNEEPGVTYFDDLYQFSTTSSLTTIARTAFAGRRITLAHRIYDLVRYAHDILSDSNYRLVFGYIILDGRVQKLADTRNYYTHFSDSKKANAWSIESLHHLNFGLFMMLKILLLKKTGFTDKTIRRLIGKFDRHYFGI